MRDPMRIALTALVMTSLVFVHLTDAVRPGWTALMATATLLAATRPELALRAWWRLTWNVGVLAVFAVLVRHTMTAGPRYLLEDGLTLAAFCQVHLLCVMTKEQRPDLLFFNTFLIALVTSFFCQDVAFSLVFAGWALTFVVALHLANAARAGDLDRATVRFVVAAGFGRGVAILLLTAGAFALWPRDFHREGLVDDALVSANVTEVDATDHVELGRSASVTLSNQEVMRVRASVDVPRHWRGATLDTFDGRIWTRQPLRSGGSGNWHGYGRKLLRSNVPPDGRANVTIISGGAERLYLPLEATRVELRAGLSRDDCNIRSDHTINLPGQTDRSGAQELAFDWSRQSAVVGNPTDPRWIDLDIHDREILDALRNALSKAGGTRRNNQAELVQRYSSWLSGFEYLLPGEQGAARSLTEFLEGSDGAHCEYFATALALMLRYSGVPCRLATGYLASEIDDTTGELVIRKKHAHAWVEVLEPDGRWRAVDPTPARSLDADEGSEHPLIAKLSEWWQRITRFSADDREAMLHELAELPMRLVVWCTTTLPGMLTAGMVVAFWIRRRRRRGDPSVIRYEKVLRQIKAERRPAETPRELLERVGPELDTTKRERLLEATTAHETARFG